MPRHAGMIGLETDLDHLFASRTIAQDLLKTTMDNIGAVQGSLRAAHLKYHLLTLDILTPPRH
jgi:hypothetical protein